MAQVVLPSIAQVFPAGTTVSAYAAPPGAGPPSGTPTTAVIATGVVAAAGSLTITGLADNQMYFLNATVNSVSQTVVASTPALVAVQSSGGLAVNGKTPVPGLGAAITSPTAPSAAYVQAEATSAKTAIDAIRVALQNVGITA